MMRRGKSVAGRPALIAGLAAALVAGAAPDARSQLLPAVDPLVAGGSHVAEDHAYHDHTAELLYDETATTPIDISAASFERASLSGADLRFVLAAGARFDRALLSAADLSDGVLTGASLRELLAVCLPDPEPDPGGGEAPPLCTHFERADLAGAELVAADLSGARFDFASLVGADLGRARLARAHLDSADFSSANLDSADLSGASLAGAIFDGAVLDWATLFAVIPACSDDDPAVCARFAGASLRRANLRGATLEGVSFAGADLSWASFEVSVLTRADFDGADLYSAILDGGDFYEARFDNASLHATRAACLPAAPPEEGEAEQSPECVRFDRASFASADLSGALLKGASFRLASFALADFASDLGAGSCPSAQPVDLRGADLFAADLSGALHFDVGCIRVDETTLANHLTRFPAGFDPVAAGITMLPEPSSLLAHAAALLVLSGLARRTGAAREHDTRFAPRSAAGPVPRELG